MLTLFVRAVMCNWMVSTGVVAAMMSTTVSGSHRHGMPVMVFFYMGFEHSIVNMFLFPTGLMLGGNFTLMDYLIWNELPTVLGQPGGRPDVCGCHPVFDALQNRPQAQGVLTTARRAGPGKPQPSALLPRSP